MRGTGWKRGGRADAFLRRVLPGPASARYSLAVLLLLIGYLAGITLRAPVGYGSTSQLLIMGTRPVALVDSGAGDGVGGGGPGSALPHVSASARFFSGLSRGGGGGGGSAVKERVLTAGAASDSTSAVYEDPYISGSDGSTDGGSGGGRASAAAAAAAAHKVLALPPASRTLRFGVCNGFANQRLAVLYGMLLAKRLGRSAVLPVLIDDGLQRSDDAILASGSNQVPFSDMYDAPYFVEAMASVGVRVLTPEEAAPVSADSPDYRSVKLGPLGWSVAAPLGAGELAAAQHLDIDCPLFKVQGGDLQPADEALLWAGLQGLRPNKEATALVDLISEAIVRHGAAKSGKAVAKAGSGSSSSAGSSSGRGGFNFIHLRIENDWLEHCSRWESIRDGLVRDNCYNNTDTIAQRLQLFGFSNSTPLYVGSYWEDVEPSRRDKIMGQLSAAGYTLVTNQDVLPAAATTTTASASASASASTAKEAGGGSAALLAGRGREFRAMVEYFVGMRAERFIGNSVSTFAALGMLERRHAGRWGAYYNGGNIPLAAVLPLLHKLPWVFTYNSWSGTYEYMLKAAVRSALHHRSFKPYCIFQGDTSSDIYGWLARHNVTLISHTPSWRGQLLEKAKAKAKENVHHSHLFKTPDMLISTFQRVDLPVVPLLDQYTYVLYTDGDVYFRKPIRLDDFGLPLPHSVSMSYEFVNMFPYNAGIILANLPTMRANYDAFIAMMLDNNDGFYYKNYGPADQGIMNKFYETDLKSRMLSQTFNTKPYNVFNPAAFIIHFHGPKPHELLRFLATGKCDFFTVCETAFLNSLCAVTREWAAFVPDEVVAMQLGDACAWIDIPGVAEIFKKRWGLTDRAATGVPQDKRADFTQDDHLRAASNGTANVEGRGARLQRALLQRRQKRRSARAVAAIEKLRLQQEKLKGGGEKEKGRDKIPGVGGGKVGGGHGKMRGTVQQLGQPQPQGKGEGQAASLMSFDTANVVTVDEAAMDKAWAEVGSSDGGDTSGLSK